MVAAEGFLLVVGLGIVILLGLRLRTRLPQLRVLAYSLIEVAGGSPNEQAVANVRGQVATIAAVNQTGPGLALKVDAELPLRSQVNPGQLEAACRSAARTAGFDPSNMSFEVIRDIGFKKTKVSVFPLIGVAGHDPISTWHSAPNQTATAETVTDYEEHPRTRPTPRPIRQGSDGTARNSHGTTADNRSAFGLVDGVSGAAWRVQEGQLIKIGRLTAPDESLQALNDLGLSRTVAEVTGHRTGISIRPLPGQVVLVDGKAPSGIIPPGTAVTIVGRYGPCECQVEWARSANVYKAQ